MSAKMSIIEHNKLYFDSGDLDVIREDILSRYHYTIGQYSENTGINFPLVRANCIFDRPNIITDTNAYWPTTVARWSIDRRGYITIKLCH